MQQLSCASVLVPAGSSSELRRVLVPTFLSTSLASLCWTGMFCRGHQIGALVSMQSTPLHRGRAELEERAARLEKQYADETVRVSSCCAMLC